MKKYKLTKTTRVIFGRTLYQIKALKDFSDVRKGDVGGWVEKEENLSQEGNAWIYGNAQVYDNAWVSGDAQVCGNAQVYGNARVYDDAQVYGNVYVYGNTWVLGDAWIYGKLKIGTGYFFGHKRRKEKIKFKKLDDDYDVIYKDYVKFDIEENGKIEP